MEASAELHTSAALTPEKQVFYNLKWNQNNSGYYAEEKIVFTYR
jgi:hypothetical protein